MITLVIKQTIRTGSFIAAFLLFTLSCQKEEFNAPETDELTVDQAKAFVEMQQSLNFTLKSGNMPKQSIQIKADWEKAKSSSNDDVSVVETQIQALGRFGFSTAESMNAWKETQNDAYIFSMSRLVVIKQKETNETVSFIMSIAGDKQYLDSKNFNIWDNTYLKRDKTLSGYVLFHTLSGEFINGWVYCDGKITGTITQNTGLDLSLNLKSAQVVLYQWVEECTDYYTVGWVYGEIVSITYTGTSCTSRLVTVGGYDTGAYSGSSYLSSAGGINNTANIQTTSFDKIISNYNNLNATQKKLFENNLNELIQTCGMKAIYDYFTNHGFKIGVNMNGNISASAAYDPLTNTLQFKDNSSFENPSGTKEELIHAFQDSYYPGGIDKYVRNGQSTPGFCNIEFEAKVITDLVTPGCCSVFSNNLEIQNEYIKWINKIKNNSFKIDTIEYADWTKRFRENHPEYNSPVSAELKNPAALNSISQKFCILN